MFYKEQNLQHAHRTDLKTIGIVEVLNLIYGRDRWLQPGLVSYEAQCEAVNEWCEENNHMLYERPRQAFNRSEGIQLALDGKYKGVVFSDLS